MTAPETSTEPAKPSGSGSGDGADEEDLNSFMARLTRDLGRSHVLVVVLAFVFAFLIGSVLVIVSDAEVRASAGYFFARPGDTIVAALVAVRDAYYAMFRGAVFDPLAFSRRAESLRAAGGSGTYVFFPALAIGLRPLTETLTVASPLIIASAGIAVGFRAGLFNIGGMGQLIAGAVSAGVVGFAIDLPVVIHLLACLAAGILGGAIWGGIAGALKALFGANEVISTIMLNWIAYYGLQFALKTDFFNGGRDQPTSLSVTSNAELPLLLGPQFRLHAGIIVAALAIVFMWWLMSRSTLGFRFRAVGSNPRAAQVAGISVGMSSFGVLLIGGALVGLGGAVQVLGTEHHLTGGIAGNVGFDAITVALLGRSSPVGVALAGLLFAGLSTGGRFMDPTAQVPAELAAIIQSLVVLFIAAPALVRQMAFLQRRTKSGRRKSTEPKREPA